MLKDFTEIFTILLCLAFIGYIFSLEGLFYKILLVVLCVVFALYIAKHYEETIKLLTSKIYGLWKRLDRRKIASEFEGKINHYSKRISSEELIGRRPYGVKIKFISGKEKEEDIFGEGDLILRIRDSGNPNRNFIVVSMRFISKTIIPEAKHYLSKTLSRSIDLFSVKKLIEEEKADLNTQFYNEYCHTEIKEDPKINECFRYYDLIDTEGFFNRILIQELFFLGEKANFRFTYEDSRITNEVVGLINFLKNIVTKKPREKDASLDFVGRLLKTSVILVALGEKRETGDPSPYVYQMEKLLKLGMENIYLLASGPNIVFAKKIAHRYLNKNPNIKKVKEYKYKNKEKFPLFLVLYKSLS